jgi:hypothetical protein
MGEYFRLLYVFEEEDRGLVAMEGKDGLGMSFEPFFHLTLGLK